MDFPKKLSLTQSEQVLLCFGLFFFFTLSHIAPHPPKKKNADVPPTDLHVFPTSKSEQTSAAPTDNDRLILKDE